MCLGNFPSSFPTLLPAGRHRAGSGQGSLEDWSEKCKNGKALQGRHIPISGHPDHEIRRKLFLVSFSYSRLDIFKFHEFKVMTRTTFRGYHDPIINIMKAVICIFTVFLFLRASRSGHFLPVYSSSHLVMMKIVWVENYLLQDVVKALGTEGWHGWRGGSHTLVIKCWHHLFYLAPEFMIYLLLLVLSLSFDRLGNLRKVISS